MPSSTGTGSEAYRTSGSSASGPAITLAFPRGTPRSSQDSGLPAGPLPSASDTFAIGSSLFIWARSSEVKGGTVEPFVTRLRNDQHGYLFLQNSSDDDRPNAYAYKIARRSGNRPCTHTGGQRRVYWEIIGSVDLAAFLSITAGSRGKHVLCTVGSSFDVTQEPYHAYFKLHKAEAAPDSLSPLPEYQSSAPPPQQLSNTARLSPQRSSQASARQGQGTSAPFFTPADYWARLQVVPPDFTNAESFFISLLVKDKKTSEWRRAWSKASHRIAYLRPEEYPKSKSSIPDDATVLKVQECSSGPRGHRAWRKLGACLYGDIAGHIGRSIWSEYGYQEGSAVRKDVAVRKVWVVRLSE